MSNFINVSASINLDTEKVWDFYTEPEHIKKWNFASDDWHCPFAENELKVGGRYIARMEAKDGSFGFDYEAVYSAISPLKSIVYKLTDGRMVKISFSSKESSVDLSIDFEPEETNTHARQKEGWQAILNNFKLYAEQQ